MNKQIKNKDLSILTAEEVAQVLKMKLSWVRQRVHRDEIPYLKIGNLVRFKMDEIENWLETKRENI